jgi:hypothetical protein
MRLASADLLQPFVLIQNFDVNIYFLQFFKGSLTLESTGVLMLDNF